MSTRSGSAGRSRRRGAAGPPRSGGAPAQPAAARGMARRPGSLRSGRDDHRASARHLDPPWARCAPPRTLVQEPPPRGDPDASLSLFAVSGTGSAARRDCAAPAPSSGAAHLLVAATLAGSAARIRPRSRSALGHRTGRPGLPVRTARTRTAAAPPPRAGHTAAAPWTGPAVCGSFAVGLPWSGPGKLQALGATLTSLRAPLLPLRYHGLRRSAYRCRRCLMGEDGAGILSGVINAGQSRFPANSRGS